MAKTVKQQIDDITNKIKLELQTSMQNKRFFETIGKDISKQIKTRTQLGYGVTETGTKTKLNALKPSTKKTRQRYSGNLSELTTPAKSNLTATGQMLDGIDYEANRNSVKILITGNRSRELSGGKSKLSNKKVAEYVQEKGRPFFNLAGFEVAGLKRTIEALIKEMVKKFQ